MLKFTVQLAGAASLCAAATLAQAQAYGLPITLELSLIVALVAVAGGMVYSAFSYLLHSEELRVLLRLARARG